MTDNVNSRDLVLEILLAVTRDGEYSHLAIRSILEKYQYLDKRDRSFITIVAEGTLENMIQIDYILNQFSSTKVNKMKPVIRNILRMGVFQMKYMDSVPDSAICNEAVNLAGKRGFKNLKGFVNGVLRNISRNLDTVTFPDAATEFSIPEWLMKQWESDYGKEKAISLAKASHTQAPTVIRVCKDKIEPSKLIKRLDEQGIKTCKVDTGVIVPGLELDYVYTIENYDYIAGIPEFEEGLFVVQDISSILVCEVAEPKPGMKVIDVCAAPGGKSLHMAKLVGESGHVDARDKSEYKTDMIEDNIYRQQADNVTAKVWDATVLDKDSVETADIVIADLPCSGLGIIRRKTDIKYHMTSEGCASLARLQQEMLGVVSSYVKKGGVLMFSTCTMNRGENDNNVKEFLEMHSDFELVFQKQLFFDNGISDGFFISKMIRK